MNARPDFNEVCLKLHGVVGVDFDSQAVQTFLENADGHDVNVSVNSPGGSAFEGIAIYQAFSDYTGKVTVEVSTLAASAASVMIMSANKIVMREGSMMMIHDPSTVTIGDAKEHTRSLGMLDTIASSAARLYEKKSGQSKRKIRAMMDAETWFTCDEAVDAGFADYVEGETKLSFPSFKYESFQNAPAAVMAFNDPDFSFLDLAKKRKGNEMNTKSKTKQNAPSAGVDPVSGTTALDIIADFQKRVPSLGLDDYQVSAVMSAMAQKGENLTPADVQKIVLEQISTPPNQIIPARNANSFGWGSMQDPHFRDTALQSALLANLEGRALDANDPGSEFQGLTMSEMAIKRAEMGGVPGRELRGGRGLANALAYRSPNASMSGGWYSTGDFSGVLAPVIEKVTLERTEAFLSDITKLAASVNFDGYNPTRFVQANGMDDLPDNGEFSEIRFINLGTDYEDVSAGVSAGQVSLSERVLRGDTNSIIVSQITNASRAAASTINKKLRAAILGADGFGSVLRDGKSLFHADRGNLAQPESVGLTEASLAQAEKTIMTQRVGDELDPAGFKPKFLLVGAELKVSAQKLIASITPNNADSVNPFSNAFELLVDPAIEDNSWRLFSDPIQAPVLVSGYMDGATGPQVDIEEAFNFLGMKFRIVVRYGSGLVGWRGCFMNPGGVVQA